MDIEELENMKLQMRVLVDLYSDTNNNVIDIADFLKDMSKEFRKMTRTLTKIQKNLKESSNNITS